MDEALPNGEALVICIASSRSLTRTIIATGPKISSLQIVMSGVQLSNTVGAM